MLHGKTAVTRNASSSNAVQMLQELQQDKEELLLRVQNLKKVCGSDAWQTATMSYLSQQLLHSSQQPETDQVLPCAAPALQPFPSGQLQWQSAAAASQSS